MRIQHNIMAMNAYRNYNTNTSALSKNLEKLSSGYKINRAGDDAAGLAISEKMRAQITGLNAASKNVKDGISLVKTAEGAMQEIQDMLNRMDYLATQSANGTYDNEVDRLNLDKEMTALKDEIDRIADSANFNGIKLLDGSLQDAVTQATTTTTTTISIGDMTALGAASIAATAANPVIGTNTVEFKEGTKAQKTKLEIDVSQIEWTAAAQSDTLEIKVGNYTLTLTATQAGKFDVKGAVSTAIGTGKTTEISAGTTNAEFNVTYADGILTLEMAKDPVAGEYDAGDLDPSKSVTVTPSAGTGNFQWNAGALNMVRGQEAVAGTPANTFITTANLGIQGSGKDDGFVMEIDGQKFVIAAGKDSEFAGGVDGATVVKVETDDTAEKVMEKLANAINAAGTVWSAGVDGTGALTLAQTDTSDDAKNEVFKTKAGIAGTIKTGTATATTTTETKEPTDIQKNANPLTLQIGDTSDSFNQLAVKIGDLHVKAMGTGKGTKDGKEFDVTKSIADISVDTQANAQEAIFTIKNAINYVSGIRGDLGAVQNRLEHTANNLSVMAENIQDAESTIRDTDVAEEMMSYTKNNILIQSAQAMLAQANAVPQGVLQLLG